MTGQNHFCGKFLLTICCTNLGSPLATNFPHFGREEEMQRTRRRIDAALKASIGLEAVREQQSVADLAH
jgi:hypothetical protein